MHVSTFGGLFSAGQVIGQVSLQWAAEWPGRKGAMWVFTALLTLAVVVECVSTVWWHWTLAKFIAGVRIGSVQATLPVHVVHLGGLMASIGLKAQSNTPPLNWKTPLYTQFATIGVSIIIFVFLPESPWWLVSKDKTDKARTILSKRHKHVEGYDVDREFGIISATITQQRAWDLETKARGPKAMLTGLNLKRFLIGAYAKVLQQVLGLSVFSNYSTYFYQLAGNEDPFLVTIILGCVSLISVICDALFGVIRASKAQLYASQLLAHLTNLYCTNWFGQPQLMQPFTLWGVIRLVVMAVSPLRGFGFPEWTR